MYCLHLLSIGLFLDLIITNVLCVDPKFDPSTRMRLVLVPADASVGSVIYRLRASDEEFDYPLQFELVGVSPSSTFQIDTLPCTKYNSVCQANVVLTRRLEPGRYYDFQVSVKDTKGGTATQSCSITATNFTTPHDVIFPRKTGIIMVPENAKRGTELDYVVSRKNPLYPKPVYLELWGSPLFAIRQKIVSPEMTEGTIFLLGPLDFETQSMYHLTLLASDAYAEPGQDSRNIAGIEVIVVVEDVQDQPPVFTSAQPVTRLPAGLIPGDKILQVHAEDGDKGIPREIRYGLVSEGNPFTSFFEINETSGEIKLVKPLDEISAITHAGDPVLLTVIAEEVKVTRDEPAAMSTTVQLAFFLPERSNSPPYFENDHYVTRVEENAPPGTALIFSDPYIARVVDEDAGQNGVFSLTLLNNNGTFEISPNVGERRANFVIRVRDNSLLDYEERQVVYFEILAQELGPATNLSAKVNVTVHIADMNDNPPVFAQEEYRVQLPENMTAGTKVVQVHADDVDTGMGGKVRYTQILGYLNTSLNLDAATGIITVSTNNHGFDREVMPEYHLYIEARDNDGIGNRAEVPLIIELMDVNDETPTFEKSLYEFILTPDLRNFTIPAFIKAIDNDSESPNNIVRYELIYGNYENKFYLNEITGQLTLREPLMKKTGQNSRKGRQANDPNTESEVFVLTARAFDLGVPVRWSTTTIRVYPPESRTRMVTFVVPGINPDRQKIEETLQEITGGRVIIQDIRPYTGAILGATEVGSSGGRDRSVVTATVLYDSNSVVDIAKIQQKLSNEQNSGIIIREDSSANAYKAENRVLFWMLILLAILLAIGILTLLLCCICPWCPLYAATRKRVIRVNSTEDDVHLVHREMGIGTQTKSVQVAEWMGRREAWSADSDTRTKPTRWEFTKRGHPHQKLAHENNVNIDDEEEEEEQEISDKKLNKLRNEQKRDISTTKEFQLHHSRTNLINDRDVYVEDVDDRQEYPSISRVNRKKHEIDEDSMRRHEIDRGSEADYRRDSMKRQTAAADDIVPAARDQLFIKDGNAEILRLITRGKNDENNLYVNVPQQHAINTQQPQVIMVDNGGKEILMRRYIEEQANGKQVIREHYQVIPGATYVQTIPNEIQQHSRANSIIYQTIDPGGEVKVIHNQHLQASTSRQNMENEATQMSHATSNHSLIHQELEISLKQQNELLRQILLDKEKLVEKQNQQELAFETQSLPGHSMAIATQTHLECEQGVQTDSPKQTRSARRRARSENDDSLTEDEYEYVRYSPPDSPDGVYWIKRRRQRKKSKYKPDEKSRRKFITVEAVKRQIRTPIKEESEEWQSKSPPLLRQAQETRSSMLRRLKSQDLMKKERLKKDVLMEISDSLDDRNAPKERRKEQQKIYKKNIKYYEDSDGSEKEVVIRKNYFSADSLEDLNNESENINYTKYVKRTSESVPPTPGHRLSRRDIITTRAEESKRRRQTESEPPTNRQMKGPAPKPPEQSSKSKKPTRETAQSESNLIQRMEEEFDGTGTSAKYMDWYYNNQSRSKDTSLEKYQKSKASNVVSSRKNDKFNGRRKSSVSTTRSDNDFESARTKPEPKPRKSPPKNTRFLKEDIELAKRVASKTNNDASHSLLQHSSHRFEHEYEEAAPPILPPAAKLPHYMYPETPPQAKIQIKIKDNNNSNKPKPSPIRENERKETKTTRIIIDNKSKQLNVSTLEDDHDSGIAMNSLLHTKGKRNPIVDKKSVFTIAYDDVVKIKQISESDSPPFS